jgi:hypothetical protein
MLMVLLDVFADFTFVNPALLGLNKKIKQRSSNLGESHLRTQAEGPLQGGQFPITGLDVFLSNVKLILIL